MQLAKTGMGYVAVWDAGGVEMAVDHLRRRSGELHAELIVSAASTSVGRGHLHRASFNLSSTTARDRLAKTLNDRAGAIRWQDHLEEFCAAVLAADRQGAPIIEVGNGHFPPRTDTGFLVDSLIPAGKTTIIYAAGGTGKSYLGVLASVCVATGAPMLGHAIARRGRVLYLDWETDQYEVDERVKRVAAGLGVSSPSILYRACAGSLDDMAEAMSGEIAKQGVVLTIVDSVGMASGTSRDGSGAEEGAIRLFGAFRQLGTTVLAIDHVTGEDVKSDRATMKPYGSIYKVNLARAVWELRGSMSSETNPLEGHLALYHRKVNAGRLSAPVGIRVSHTDDATAFHREEVSDEGLVRAMTTSARLALSLRSGPMTVPDLATDLGVTDGVVRVTLHRGNGRQFTKLADGRWALVHVEEHA